MINVSACTLMDGGMVAREFTRISREALTL